MAESTYYARVRSTSERLDRCINPHMWMFLEGQEGPQSIIKSQRQSLGRKKKKEKRKLTFKNTERDVEKQ